MKNFRKTAIVYLLFPGIYLIIVDAKLISSRYRPLEVLNPFSAAPVLFAEQTGSTMADAEAWLNGAPQSGTVLVTAYQSRGVGRKEGRRWHAQRGMNLLFTLLLEQSDVNLEPQLVPIAAGLALCRFLENQYGLKPRIKWPNDVLVAGKKIAGILCRLKSGWFVIGIGMNVNESAFPLKLHIPATSLYMETGSAADPVSLLPALLDCLKHSFADRAWRDDVQARLFGIGKEVLVTGAGGDPLGGVGEYPAVVHGIDEIGRLLVLPMQSTEVQALAGGEISIGNRHLDVHKQITRHMTGLSAAVRKTVDLRFGLNQNLDAIFTALGRIPGLSLPNSFSRGRYAAALGESLLGSFTAGAAGSEDEIGVSAGTDMLLALWFREFLWMLRFRAEPGLAPHKKFFSGNEYEAVLRGACRSGAKAGIHFILGRLDDSPLADSYKAELLQSHIRDGAGAEVLKVLKQAAFSGSLNEQKMIYLFQLSAELKLPVFGKKMVRRLLMLPEGADESFSAALMYVSTLKMREYLPLLEDLLYHASSGDARKLLLISALAGFYDDAPGALRAFLSKVRDHVLADEKPSPIILNHVDCCLRKADEPSARTRGLTVIQCSCVDGSRKPGEGNAGGVNVFILTLGDALAREQGIGGVYSMLLINLAEPLTVERLFEERAPGHHVIRLPVYLPGGITQISLMNRQFQLEFWIERTLLLYGIKPDLFHIRYTHNGSMALLNTAKRLNAFTVFTLTPDPHMQLSGKYENYGASAGQPADISFDLHRVFLADRILGRTGGVVVLSQDHGLGNIYSYFPQLGIDPALTAKPLKLVSEGIDISAEGLQDFSREDFVSLMGGREGRPDSFPFGLNREYIEKPIMLNAGRFHPVKQQYLLAEAWIVSGLWEAYNLVIVGGSASHPGPEERDFIEKINRLSAAHPETAGRLVILDAVENDTLRGLEHWITDNIVPPMPHVYGCSSFKEEFGIAILEAMEAGFLILGPQRGGLPGYITPEENGFLINTDSAGDIAEALSAVLLSGAYTSRALREIALRGSKEIRENYSISRVVKDYSAFYKEVVQHGL